MDCVLCYLSQEEDHAEVISRFELWSEESCEDPQVEESVMLR